jgi:hypothetical protein
MRQRRSAPAIGVGILAIVSVVLAAAGVEAAGGTSQVAVKGEPAYEQDHWPKGTKELLDVPTRGDGWNGWFSEWPSDVCHYEFKVATSDEVNAVIAQFVKIESEDLHIRLSPLKEPQGLDWVTSLPEGNGTAIMFSIGNQQRVNDWFGRLPGGKFGKMEFEKTPVAVLPTLTIFVGHKAVDLAELKVPQEIDVSAGYVPTIFWEWNRTNLPARQPATDDAPVPAETQQAMDAISDFLHERQDSEQGTSPR